MKKKPRRQLKENIRKRLQKEVEQLWKDYCKKRDGYKCRLCGSTTVLQVHHIFSRKKTILFIDIDNGITLCRRCHKSATHSDTKKETIRRMIPNDIYEILYEQSKFIGAFLDWKNINWLERQCKILKEMISELPSKT